VADHPDITRLAELLISRQDQQQQQLDLLTKNSTNTIELLVGHQQQIDLLVEKITKTDSVVEIFGQIQSQLINQLELIYTEQQRFNQKQESFNERQEKFNERQEKFNERQDQFNIIFLDEIRGMKKELKMLVEVVMTRHEERLKRLEDFMDGFMRKAG
jgi:ABC-type transporter Mla subunit MlaD